MLKDRKIDESSFVADCIRFKELGSRLKTFPLDPYRNIEKDKQNEIG